MGKTSRISDRYQQKSLLKNPLQGLIPHIIRLRINHLALQNEVGKYLCSQEALVGNLDSDGPQPGRGMWVKEEVIHRFRRSTG